MDEYTFWGDNCSVLTELLTPGFTQMENDLLSEHKLYTVENTRIIPLTKNNAKKIYKKMSPLLSQWMCYSFIKDSP